MVDCGLGLVLKIDVWLFAKQYKELCPILNKIGDLERPSSFNLTMPAGLQGVSIHDLRHTYASNAVSSGMPIQMVGRFFGHTQLQTTMRYAHLADDPVRRAAEENAEKLSLALGHFAEPQSHLRFVE